MMTILKSSCAITALSFALLAAPVQAAPIQQPENIQQVSASSAIKQIVRCASKPACRKALTEAMKKALEKFSVILDVIGGQIGEIYEAGLKAIEEGDRTQLAAVKKQLEQARIALAKEAAKNTELQARNKILQVQLNQIYRILTALENDMDVGV